MDEGDTTFAYGDYQADFEDDFEEEKSDTAKPSSIANPVVSETTQPASTAKPRQTQPISGRKRSKRRHRRTPHSQSPPKQDKSPGDSEAPAAHRRPKIMRNPHRLSPRLSRTYDPAELKNEIIQRQITIDELQQEVKGLKMTLRRQERGLTDAAGRLANPTKELEHAKEEIRTLRERQRKAAARERRLEAEAREAKRATILARKKLHSLGSGAESAAAAADTIAQLQQRLGASAADLAKAQRQVSVLERARQSGVGKARAEVRDLRGMLAKEQSRASSFDSETARLRREVSALTIQLRHLKRGRRGSPVRERAPQRVVESSTPVVESHHGTSVIDVDPVPVDAGVLGGTFVTADDCPSSDVELLELEETPASEN